MTVSPIGPIKIDHSPFTPPTVTYDPTTTSWISTPAPGMDTAKTTNNRNLKNSFDSETFLKLLVAQLKYQDPTKPADTGQLMQQTATLSMVERINQMATSAEEMVKVSKDLAASNVAMSRSYATMLAQQQRSSAVALVGRTVLYTDPTNPGTTLEGIVKSVRFETNGPMLDVGGKDVALTSVTALKATA